MDIVEAIDVQRTEEKEAQGTAQLEAQEAHDDLQATLAELTAVAEKSFAGIVSDRRETEIVRLAQALLIEMVGNMRDRAFRESVWTHADQFDETMNASLVAMAFEQADAFYEVVTQRHKKLLAVRG